MRGCRSLMLMGIVMAWLAAPMPSRASVVFDAPFQGERWVSGCDGAAGTALNALFVVCTGGVSAMSDGTVATALSYDTGADGTLMRPAIGNPTNYGDASAYAIYHPPTTEPFRVRIHLGPTSTIASTRSSTVSTAQATATVVAFARCMGGLESHGSEPPTDRWGGCFATRVVTPSSDGSMIELEVSPEGMGDDGIAIGVMTHAFVRLIGSPIARDPYDGRPVACLPVRDPRPPSENPELCAYGTIVELPKWLQGEAVAESHALLRAVEIL